jgi:hypothetical protein
VAARLPDRQRRIKSLNPLLAKSERPTRLLGSFQVGLTTGRFGAVAETVPLWR